MKIKILLFYLFFIFISNGCSSGKNIEQNDEVAITDVEQNEESVSHDTIRIVPIDISDIIPRD